MLIAVTPQSGSIGNVRLVLERTCGITGKVSRTDFFQWQPPVITASCLVRFPVPVRLGIRYKPEAGVSGLYFAQFQAATSRLAARSRVAMSRASSAVGAACK